MNQEENQKSTPQIPTQEPVTPPSQPNILSTPQNSIPSSPIKSRKKILIPILIVIFLLLVAGGVFTFYHYNHGFKLSSNSPVAQKNHDMKTEQDLATLDKVTQNYVSSQKCTTLPKNLSQLNLGSHKLNYPLKEYSYKNEGADCGGPNDYQFQLCATFQTNTFSLDGSNNYNPSDGSTADSYSLHDKGVQCWTDGGGGYGPGFQIVDTSHETYINNTAQASNINLSQTAATLQGQYIQQANLLGLSPVPSDLDKGCAVSASHTSANQKLYLCSIMIKKSLITSASPSTLYALFQKFQSLNQQQGYINSGLENPSTPFYACITAPKIGDLTPEIDCSYLSNTKDGYCSLTIRYSSALNPPNETITYLMDCNNIPYVLNVPSGFKLVSQSDPVFTGGK